GSYGHREPQSFRSERRMDIGQKSGKSIEILGSGVLPVKISAVIAVDGQQVGQIRREFQSQGRTAHYGRQSALTAVIRHADVDVRPVFLLYLFEKSRPGG